MNAKNFARLLSGIAVLLAAWPAWTNANPIITVGPGASSLIYTGGDGGGGRTNIDLDHTQTLGPGTYQATLFDVTTTTTGAVIPFLAQFNGPSASPGNANDLFQVLAYGNSDAVGSGLHTSTFAFGGSNTFTLATTTTIYVGVTDDSTQSSISSAVGFVGGGNDNHNNSGGPGAGGSFAPSVGGIVPGWSNANLGRTYGFDVQFTQLPEPSSFVLGGLGVVGLLIAARRRRKSVSALAIITLVVASVASQANADSFSVVNLPNTTTDFGYLNSASNGKDVLQVNLNGAAVSINGANFAKDTTGSGTGTGSVTYALTGSGLTAFSGFGSGATDSNVGSLLSDFFYGGSSPDETLTINNLTPGRYVTLTVLGAAFGAGATSGREELVTGSGGATINYEENNGMFSTLTYTTVVPPSGTISITSHATDGGGDTLHYYGFTVATPEPSSFVLGGLGVVGLLLAARRRLRKA